MNGNLSGASAPDGASAAAPTAEQTPATAATTSAPHESGSDASAPAGESSAAASASGERASSELRGKRGGKRRAAAYAPDSALAASTAVAAGSGGTAPEGGPSAPGPEGESAATASAPGEHKGKKGKRKLKGKLKIVHQVPGRIRMKIPSAKGNEEQLANYKEVLTLLPGVEEIDVNPVTGSIILKYDPDLNRNLHTRIDTHLDGHSELPVRRSKPPPNNEIDAVAQKIQQEAEYLAEHSQTARAFVDFCAKVDKEIKVASKNVIDLKMLLAVGVIGFTVLEVGAAAATPVWVTLTLFGLNHFIEMQSDEDEAEPSAAGAGASAPATPQPATSPATPSPATPQVAATAKATT